MNIHLAMFLKKIAPLFANKMDVFFYISLPVLLFLMFYSFADYFNDTIYFGRGEYHNDLVVTSHIRHCYSNRYVLNAFIEKSNGDVDRIHCSGTLTDEYYFVPEDMKNGCFGSYRIKKLSKGCYMMESDSVDSFTQHFFFCKIDVKHKMA
ncbi:hypothetical protein [Photobacterium aquae]|nr:hypothetical protein [Photobacterium aquae]